MKSKTRQIVMAVSAGICATAVLGGAISLFLSSGSDEISSPVFSLRGNYLTAFAEDKDVNSSTETEPEAESQTEPGATLATKYIMSTNNEYMLLVTAFNLNDAGTGDWVGYVINDESELSQYYYTGIKFSEDNILSVSDVIGEDLNAKDYALIVTEIEYDEDSAYSYYAVVKTNDPEADNPVLLQSTKKSVAAGGRLSAKLKEGQSEVYVDYEEGWSADNITWSSYVTFHKGEELSADGVTVELLDEKLSGNDVAFRISYGNSSVVYTYDVWYAINDETSFFAMNNDLTANYKVTEKFSFSTALSAPLTGGYDVTDTKADFSGILDGNNLELKDLTIEAPSSKGGIFHYNRGTIKNLILTNVDVTVANTFGTLAGDNFGVVDNCYVQGTVTSKGRDGGIVYHNRNDQGGTVTNCVFNGTVEGATTVGGVVGKVNNTAKASGLENNLFIYGKTGIQVAVSNVTEETNKAVNANEYTYTENVGYNSAINTILQAYANTDRVLYVTAPSEIILTYANGGWDLSAVKDDLKVATNATNGITDFEVTSTLKSGEGVTLEVSYKGLTASTTTNIYYGISNEESFNKIADDMSAAYKITEDITFTGEVVAMGTPATDDGSVQEKAFTGVLDGNGKTLKALTIVKDSARTALTGWWEGLFAVNRGTIENLVIANGVFNINHSGVGFIAAQNKGTIKDCYVQADTFAASTEKNFIGGIAGNNNGGTIQNCVYVGPMANPTTDTKYVGGISGTTGNVNENNAFIRTGESGATTCIGAAADQNNNTTSYILDLTNDSHTGVTDAQWSLLSAYRAEKWPDIIVYNVTVDGNQVSFKYYLGTVGKSIEYIYSWKSTHYYYSTHDNVTIEGNQATCTLVAADYENLTQTTEFTMGVIFNLNAGGTSSYKTFSVTVTPPPAVEAEDIVIDYAGGGWSLESIDISDIKNYLTVKVEGEAVEDYELNGTVQNGENVEFAVAYNGLTTTAKVNIYYGISDVESFKAMSNDLTAAYKIMNDIDFSGNTFNTSFGEFSGVLDGNGKVLSNITAEFASEQSLFNKLESGAVLKNLVMTNVKCESEGLSAFLVHSNYGTVENCYVQGRVDVTTTWASGIVYDNYATVNGCTFVGWVNDVDGKYIGAIVCSNGSGGTATGNKFIRVEGTSTLCATTCINGGDGDNTTIQWKDITADNYTTYGITEEQYQYMKDYVVCISLEQADGVLTASLFVGDKLTTVDYCHAWGDYWPQGAAVPYSFNKETSTLTINLTDGGLGLAVGNTFSLGIRINGVYYTYSITVA